MSDENSEIKSDKSEISVTTIDISEHKQEIIKLLQEENKANFLNKKFLQLFENFLTSEQPSLKQINLTPEIQKYFLLLCKEYPDLFGTFEQSLKKIIQDDKIDTKDIPDILILVSKIYQIMSKDKRNMIPNVEPYELIKILLHISLIIYIETNKVKNETLLSDVLKIIDASIDLLKLMPIKISKKCCFNSLFCC